jgi:hypothetical protein
MVDEANPKYSDCVIVCGGHTFPAHKAVVCSHPKFFAKASGHVFSLCCNFFDPLFVDPNNLQEAISDKIELHDHPLAVQIMLDFFDKYDYKFYMGYDFASPSVHEAIF